MRCAGWPRALQSFLLSAKTARFHYGTFDCCLFAADAVFIMTGVDPAAPYRRRYSSRREAMALVRDTIENMVAREMQAAGFPEIPPLFAGRGDLCLIRRPHHDASLGIVDLTGNSIVVMSARGAGLIPHVRAARAWRI